MKPEQPGTSNLAAAKSLEGRVWDLMGQNNAKQAIAECEKLNRQYPEFGSGWHTTSHLMMRLGNVPAALAAIERATSIDPEQIDWQLQKTKCLVRLGRVDEVDAAVKALSAREMSTAYQCAAMGLLYTQLGSRELAVDLYKKAIELEPDKARNYYNIACLQRTLGDIEPAELTRRSAWILPITSPTRFVQIFAGKLQSAIISMNLSSCWAERLRTNVAEFSFAMRWRKSWKIWEKQSGHSIA